MNSTLSVLIPGSMFWSTTNVRTVSPALTSSTTDNATSITTSRLRVRPPCVSAPVLRPARSASVTSAFDVCSAGTSPKTMPVSKDTASEKRSTGTLIGHPRLVRHVELGHQRDDGANRAEGEEHAERAAGEGEQDALGQELAQQPAAAGANRHPDRHLARPRRAAGQLQVGDVGARDEEQERDRAEQQLQAGPHLSARDRHVQIIAQPGGEALLGKRRRLLEREALVERAELLFGDDLRYTGRQPHDGIDPRHIRARGREREPEPLAPIPAEARRHHADNRVRATVQSKRPADRRGAPLEQPQPQLVAQHDDRFSAAVRPDVRRLDGPADHRRDAEKIEGVAGQEDATEALGRELSRHEHGFNRGRHHIGERRYLGQGTKLVERVPVPAAAVDRANLRGPDLARAGRRDTAR